MFAGRGKGEEGELFRGTWKRDIYKCRPINRFIAGRYKVFPFTRGEEIFALDSIARFIDRGEGGG